MNLFNPWSIQLPSTISMNGVPFMGAKHLGISFNTGFKRVPKPPAKITVSVTDKSILAIVNYPDVSNKLF